MTEDGPNTGFSTPLADRIAELCRGLVYLSETDAPVDVFIGGRCRGTVEECLRHSLGLPRSMRIDEQDADEFFRRLITVREWHGPQQRAIVRRFTKLAELLSRELRNLTVLRIGNIRISIFVAGIDRDGNFVGVKTQAVET